jgi:hypothetical protein
MRKPKIGIVKQGRMRRMLQDAAPRSHHGNRLRCKRCGVLLCRAKVTKPPPRGAWWMRNNGQRSGVAARVSLHVPRIHVGHFEIVPARFDEKRGDASQLGHNGGPRIGDGASAAGSFH